MIILIITIFFFGIYAALIIYYRTSWMQIPHTGNLPAGSTGKQTFISVLIPARNEESNIGRCLESVTSQTYPSGLFESIVIDDFSGDNTAAIVRSFSDKNVSLIELKDFVGDREINSYKKKAIEIAVAKAKGDLIVTTDADCIVPDTWLETIAEFYEKHRPVFIVAPVAYLQPLPGDPLYVEFLKIFQSLDFMSLQGITGASVFKKFHNMCNGANLAYLKRVFYEVEGFKGIDAIASGDDMLLMHKIMERYPGEVLYIKSAGVIVNTAPMDTLSGFLNQRIRWASKAGKYRDNKITLVLLLTYLFNVWFFLLALLSFFFRYAFECLAVFFILKTAVELYFLYPVAKFFEKEKILWWFPVAQPFHILYTIVAGFLGMFGRYRWKERKVR